MEVAQRFNTDSDVYTGLLSEEQELLLLESSETQCRGSLCSEESSCQRMEAEVGGPGKLV